MKLDGKTTSGLEFLGKQKTRGRRRGMTNDQLAELKRLHGAATSGDFTIDRYHTLLDADGELVLFTGIQTPMTNGDRQDQARANMAEYAALHNAFPFLIARLEQVEADLDAANERAAKENKD